ncbi:hypothetical protein EV127DRAFT_484516 [Xylaria flabelliformis]|nr:hypothetical protein EV127DRAFT_484516 [Xylaria flabelliformis]
MRTTMNMLAMPRLASLYGQQSHGQYATQHRYSNMGFEVEGQSAFPHDIRSLGLLLAGHEPITITITTSNTSTTATNNANTGLANAPARRSHPCGIDNCPFTSATATGIREHQKNKGATGGFSDGEFCEHTTSSHEELYEHFNRAHG